jgi:hypothetical protein
LVLTTQRISHCDIELWAVEGAVAWIHLPVYAGGSRGAQRNRWTNECS